MRRNRLRFESIISHSRVYVCMYSTRRILESHILLAIGYCYHFYEPDVQNFTYNYHDFGLSYQFCLKKCFRH